MNAHAKHVTGAKDVTVQTLARMMLDQAGGNVASAAEKLVNYTLGSALGKTPRLAIDVLRIGANALLHQVPQVDRRATAAAIEAGRTMNGSAKRSQARLWSNAPKIGAMLMEAEYIIGGQRKALRDWTGSEILAHADAQLLAGASQVRNARYLQAVAKAAGDQRIGDAVTEADLAKIKRRAEESAV